MPSMSCAAADTAKHDRNKNGTLDEIPPAVETALAFVIDDVIPNQGLLWAGAVPSE